MSAARASSSRPKPERATLTVREAATYLGVSIDTVRRMIASGRLAALKVHGRGSGERVHYRIPERALDSVLAETETAARKRQRKRS